MFAIALLLGFGLLGVPAAMAGVVDGCAASPQPPRGTRLSPLIVPEWRRVRSWPICRPCLLTRRPRELTVEPLNPPFITMAERWISISRSPTTPAQRPLWRGLPLPTSQISRRDSRVWPGRRHPGRNYFVNGDAAPITADSNVNGR